MYIKQKISVVLAFLIIVQSIGFCNSHKEYTAARKNVLAANSSANNLGNLLINTEPSAIQSFPFKQQEDGLFCAIQAVLGVDTPSEIPTCLAQRGISFNELYELVESIHDGNFDGQDIFNYLNQLYEESPFYKDRRKKASLVEGIAAELRAGVTAYIDKDSDRSWRDGLISPLLSFSEIIEQYPFLALQRITAIVALDFRKTKIGMSVDKLRDRGLNCREALRIAFPELDMPDIYFGIKPNIWSRLPERSHHNFIKSFLNELEKMKLEAGSKTVLKELTKHLLNFEGKVKIAHLTDNFFSSGNLGKIPSALLVSFTVYYRILWRGKYPNKEKTFMEYLAETFEDASDTDSRKVSQAEIEAAIIPYYEKNQLRSTDAHRLLSVICKQLGIASGNEEMRQAVSKTIFTYKIYEIMREIAEDIRVKSAKIGEDQNRERRLSKIRRTALRRLRSYQLEHKERDILAGLVRYYGSYRKFYDENERKINDILGFPVKYDRDIYGNNNISGLISWIEETSKNTPAGFIGYVNPTASFVIIDSKQKPQSYFTIGGLNHLRDSYAWFGFETSRDGLDKYMLVWQNKESATRRPLYKIQLARGELILAQKWKGKKTGRIPIHLETGARDNESRKYAARRNLVSGITPASADIESDIRKMFQGMSLQAIISVIEKNGISLKDLIEILNTLTGKIYSEDILTEFFSQQGLQSFPKHNKYALWFRMPLEVHRSFIGAVVFEIGYVRDILRRSRLGLTLSTNESDIVSQLESSAYGRILIKKLSTSHGEINFESLSWVFFKLNIGRIHKKTVARFFFYYYMLRKVEAPDLGIVAFITQRTRKEETLIDGHTASEVIQQHLPLLQSCARSIFFKIRNSPTGSNFELSDLIDYGAFGLIDAVKTYDPAKNPDFRPYAVQKIRWAIIDGLREFGVRRSILAKKKKFEREETNPTGDIAKFHRDRLAAAFGMTSLDAEIGDDGLSLHQVIPFGKTSPEERVSDTEQLDRLNRAISRLPPKMRQMVLLYYGEEMTLLAIAKRFDITESRVSQILSEARRRLTTMISGTIKRKDSEQSV